MPRSARNIVGGYAYHVLNRANGRLRLFRKDADFAAFEAIMAEAHQRVPLRILGYVVMGNHWHFVVWPRRGQGEKVSAFFRWLSITHAQRWHAHHGTAGMGHVYQGRFKSFPVAADEHLRAVLRYVERNPLRAGLVDRAEDWRWSSLHRRLRGTADEQALLCESPVPLGSRGVDHVNQPQSEAEAAAIEECLSRGRPYGAEAWQQKVARQQGLEYTFRQRGRPKKAQPDGDAP
jgi:putative transposase